jgi:hypothetical protein
VLAKHSKNCFLQNALSIGVDSTQRNFEPMVKSVELWQQSRFTDVTARLIIYRAFIEAELDSVPRHLDRKLHTSCTSTRSMRSFSRGVRRLNFRFADDPPGIQLGHIRALKLTRTKVTAPLRPKVLID